MACTTQMLRHVRLLMCTQDPTAFSLNTIPSSAHLPKAISGLTSQCEIPDNLDFFNIYGNALWRTIQNTSTLVSKMTVVHYNDPTSPRMST